MEIEDVFRWLVAAYKRLEDFADNGETAVGAAGRNFLLVPPARLDDQARCFAAEFGVDLEELPGPPGRILLQFTLTGNADCQTILSALERFCEEYAP